MNFITVNTCAEFICFLAALIFLFKDKDPAWRLFIPYMLLTCIVETCGIYMRLVAHVSNYQLYNVFLLFECLMMSFTFFNLYKPYGQRKKWLIVWLCCFAAMYITELIIHHVKAFVSVTAAIMSIVFVLASLYFYYLKLNAENFEPLQFSASFWWVSGSLFFYFGSTACNIFFDYLSSSNVAVYLGYSVRSYIYYILDVILYSFWSYAFICRYIQRRSSSL